MQLRPLLVAATAACSSSRPIGEGVQGVLNERTNAIAERASAARRR